MEHYQILLTVLSGVFIVGAWITGGMGLEFLNILFYLTAIVTGGYTTIRKAIPSLFRLNFDVNVLVTIAIIGAVLIGEWVEGAVVAFLFGISEALEDFSVERARNSIRSLMQIEPKTALIRRQGTEQQVHVEDIQIGDIMVVKPGEKIAMDGKIIKGSSNINQAAITGESMPVEKGEGDEVFAGTLNVQGSLEVAVTKLVQDTTLAKIIHLVERAEEEKAPSQKFVDVFAKYYTPAIIFLAMGVTLVPPLLFGQAWEIWIYRGLALLVVACPCALVVSTPISIVSAIGNAARNGILIKGGAFLEEASRLKAIAFDKTGTLTKGSPEVTDIISVNKSKVDITSYASAIEKHSEHPLAEAIVRYAEDNESDPIEASEFESITGKGAKAKVGDTTLLIGNPRLFEELKVDLSKVKDQIQQLQEQGKTVMILGTDQELYGMIAVADQVRDTSKQAVQRLHQSGIDQMVMLTGDNNQTAKAIAETVGVDEYHGELLPENKVEAIQKLNQKYGKVATVGDGVNDAPALASASLGIAMGGAGTDTALETADIALMGDDLSKLPYLIRLSKKALQVIKQNIAIALGIKLLALALIIPGLLTLWVAILTDVGATILVALNGMRLIRFS
jgi:Cd2+/Zn2+-exporting ATPase